MDVFRPKWRDPKTKKWVRSEYYSYRFRYKKREYKGATGFRNRKKALAAGNNVRDEVLGGRFGILKETPDPPVNEFLEKSFMPYVCAEIMVAKTVSYYGVGVKLLIGSEAFDDITLGQITSEHIAKFKGTCAKWSPSYINQGLRTLKRALRLAVAWKKLSSVPQFKLLKEKGRKRVLTQDEQNLYSEFPHDERYRIFVYCFFDLGSRPVEVRHLKWSNINWDEATVSFEISKTDAGHRTLPMSDRIYSTLRQWWIKRGQPKTGLIFPQEKDKWHPHAAGNDPLTQHWVDYQHGKYRKANPTCDFTPYAGRHTALTELGKHTDPFTLMKIAGHSTIKMTEKYVHPANEQVMSAFSNRDAANKRSQIKLIK